MIGTFDEHYQRIELAYKNCQGDSIVLFNILLSESIEIGFDQALAYLEQCVIRKRMAWCDENLEKVVMTGDPLMDGHRIFYKTYLGAVMPVNGEIIHVSESTIVSRWWNKCPTLEACVSLGLDTREICKKVYETPVQAFLSRIDPRLIFKRNYDRIRPHAPYCEEIITLDPFIQGGE